jgi:hypothetical protein
LIPSRVSACHSGVWTVAYALREVNADVFLRRRWFKLPVSRWQGVREDGYLAVDDDTILTRWLHSDGNIRYYEYENDKFEYLSEHKSAEPQRGIAFMPRRGINVRHAVRYIS